jgi:hypothetical protein
MSGGDGFSFAARGVLASWLVWMPFPLRYAPAGPEDRQNDTGVTLCVIPGEPKAREGDRFQNRAPPSLPLAGRVSAKRRVGVGMSKLCMSSQKRKGRYSA